MSVAESFPVRPRDHTILNSVQPPNILDDVAPVASAFTALRDDFVKVLAAVQYSVCTDKTRIGLNRVEVESLDDRLVLLLATDGHTALMLALDFVEDHQIPLGRIGLTRESVKLFVSTKGHSPLLATPATDVFPTVRAVIKPPSEHYRGVIGFNPVYLDRMAKAMKKLGYFPGRPCRFGAGEDALAPALLSAERHLMPSAALYVTPLFVVMPQRIE